MKAYSEDLRERVLAAVDEGMERERVVKIMCVSLASIGRWGRLRREGRALAARRAPGRPRWWARGVLVPTYAWVPRGQRARTKPRATAGPTPRCWPP